MLVWQVELSWLARHVPRHRQWGQPPRTRELGPLNGNVGYRDGAAVVDIERENVVCKDYGEWKGEMATMYRLRGICLV